MIEDVVPVVIEGLVLAGVLYLTLRWILHPVVQRLPAAVDLVVDAGAALLLLPEFICTALLRLAIKRPAPLAFQYGDAVCGLACLVHGLGQAIAGGLQAATVKIGHREALIGGVGGSIGLVLLL